MNKKLILILEITWTIIGFFCIAVAAKFVVQSDGAKTILFFLMALVSFAFAFIRHRQRKKG
jgi:hypothetical protein